MQLNETKIDISKIYFHGSSESRVTRLEAPSYEHPFYVTTDLHYAMAFCTKTGSSTGEWKGHSKKYTPYSQNFVYAVTLKPDCNVFDFRDKTSPEFKKFYDVIDKDIVDWVLDSPGTYDRNDIYEFIVQLNVEVFEPLDEDKTYDEYYESRHLTTGKSLDPDISIMSKQLYKKCQKFIEKYGFQNAYKELDIHEIMAPLLKKLNQLGFQGICTSEHDSNDEASSAKVTTDYAIGIFDVNGLDILGLVPMKYEWLKKVNPSYLEDKTSSDAREKIARFIQLYKRIAMKQQLQESSIGSRQTWYFGNNRSKNLKIAKPEWYKPFFLTTSYEYAQDYADYGVYKIELADQRELNILDFNDTNEVRKLNWPDIVVKTIQAGKSDLNSIAYDLYVLAYGEGKKQLTWIEDSEEWRLAAYYFRDKSLGILDYAASGSIWGSEEDHAFLMQMWKDIYDVGFDGFMHVEFGQKVLALFDLHCIGKISPKPISKKLDEKKKYRILKKKFKAKGQAAFPNIKSDDDIVFVSDIPKEKALQLLKKACYNVSNFHPEYMEKAVKWSDDQIFGVFNKHDKRNVLAMASISYNRDESGAAYLHEMTGFIKGGYGKKLVIWLLQKFKKAYGQIALEGSGTKDDPYRPNEKLRDKFYATIPGLKIYRVENSIWDCPADFFYYGISDESIKEFLEKTYSSKEHNAIDESESLCQTMYRFCIGNVGVYEASKDLIFSTFDADKAKKKWSEVLTASNWLPKPDFQYSKEYESWFTLAGKTMFEKTVLPIIEKIGIDGIEMQKSTIDSRNIVYSDIYQAIVKLDKINEDNENDINDIKSMFDEVISQYRTTFDIDLSYMKFKVDNQPVYTNGKPCYEYDEDECAGDWTSLGWIRLNPDMKSVMDRYGVAWHGSDGIEEFTKFIIAHELAHEVWNNIADDQFKNDVIEKANDENFSAVYLETVNTKKLAEETFCEYLAHEIVQQMHTKQ